jgi:triphosphatase
MRCILAEQAAKTKLDQGAKALRAVAPKLAGEDMEAIHAARVASRRLRAAIAAHSVAIGKREEKQLEKALRKITSDLGVARELDVTIQLLDQRRAALSGAERYASTHTLNRLRELRDGERETIAAYVAYIDSDELRQRLTAAQASTRPPKSCYLDDAQTELKRRRRRLWNAHKRWLKEQSEESLHQVRIAFKKFRYGCEQYSDLYGKKMKQFIKELRTIQDDLGTWNDFRCASRYVQSLAERAEPMALSGIEPLAELLNQEAGQHLEAYRNLASGFFSKERRNATKRIVADVKVPCCAKRKKR